MPYRHGEPGVTDNEWPDGSFSQLICSFFVVALGIVAWFMHWVRARGFVRLPFIESCWDRNIDTAGAGMI
jgi:hypothetical protein